MSVDDGLSYDELTTQAELIIESMLKRSVAASDKDEQLRFRDLAHGAFTLWTKLAYRVALKIGEVDRFVADLDRMNAMFPEGARNPDNL